MADPINTTTMPGDNMNPENIETAAGQIRTVGSNVATTGGDVAKAWAGLKKGYHAPEQDTLFGAMQPAQKAATDFSTDMGKAATALETFAGEVRTIKANVAKIRADANAFLAGIHDGKVTVTQHVVQSRAQLEMGESTTTHKDVDWDSDQATVDANNALIRRVNDQQEQLWAAERKCANAIRDLYGASHIAAASDSNPNGYGVNDIPDNANMPWGHTVDRKESCGDSVVHGVGDFLGDMGKGITGLVGFSWDGWHPSWSLSTAGKNLWNFGKVLNGLSPTTPVMAMLPGPVGDYYRDSQKMATTAVGGLVGIDPYAKDPFARWKHDPVRTGTTSVLNVASFFIPGGEAGGAADGAGAAAKGAEAASDAGKASRGLDGLGDLARVTGEGGDLSKVGSAATKTELGDLGRATGELDDGLSGLGKTDIDVPNVPHDNVNIDHPNVGEHAPGDVPPARDPGQVAHEPAGAGHEPGAGGHEPGTSGHQPDATGHEPGANGHEPGTTDHNAPGQQTNPADHTPKTDSSLPKTDPKVKAEVDTIRHDIQPDLQHAADDAWKHAVARAQQAGVKPTAQRLGSYAHKYLSDWIGSHSNDLVDSGSGYRIRSEISFNRFGDEVAPGTKGSIRPDIVIERLDNNGSYEVVHAYDLKTGNASIAAGWETKVQNWLHPLDSTDTLRPQPPQPAPAGTASGGR